MPLHDGTGPMGLGPGSGRGKGRWYNGLGNQSMFPMRQGRFISIAVPLVAVVLRDALNPYGMIRRVMNLLPRQRLADDKHNIVRQAEFSVMNKKTTRLIKKKA